MRRFEACEAEHVGPEAREQPCFRGGGPDMACEARVQLSFTRDDEPRSDLQQHSGPPQSVPLSFGARRAPLATIGPERPPISVEVAGASHMSKSMLWRVRRGRRHTVANHLPDPQMRRGSSPPAGTSSVRASFREDENPRAARRRAGASRAGCSSTARAPPSRRRADRARARCRASAV